MTTQLEDRLRGVLHEMAEEISPSPPPEGLEERAAASARRRHVRAAVATVAAVAAVALVAGATAALRDPGPSFIEPVIRPPHTFRLTDTLSSDPGRSLVAVLATEGEGHPNGRSVYLQRATGGASVALTSTDRVQSAYSQQLSWDGTRVIRQSGEAADPRLEIVTLQTGSINELGGRVGYCPQLSPDNRTIAIGNTSGRLELLDARSGETLLRGGLVGEVCAAVGWSPDGRLLVVPGPNVLGTDPHPELVNDDGSTVIDAHGRPVTQLRHRLAVNSGMSWSPDGRSILLYSRDTGRYSIRDVANGSESFLQLPPGALRPLGWAGDRVVWLAGRAGDQSLISTDVTGTDPRPWMRVDAGDRPIETVQWSRDLSGRPSDER